MKVPYAIQGALFAPALVALFFILKAFCPASAGSVCFSDWFATPIFLPLVAIYRIFGEVPTASGQEVVFIFLYWALIGFLFGLVVDLMVRKKEEPVCPAPPAPRI